MCVLFYLPYFQTRRQTVYLLLENVDQLIYLNMGLVLLLIILVDICSNQLFFLNLILIVAIVLHYIMIDGKHFFEQPVENNLRTYENIRTIATGQGDDYTTGYLLDYITLIITIK